MAEWLVDQIPTIADPDPATTLLGAITAGATAASFASVAKMPTAGFTGRIVVGYGATGEIVTVTGGAGNPFTTSAFANSHAAGTQVNVVMTAAGMLNWIQSNDFNTSGEWQFATATATDLTVGGAFVLNGNATAFSVVTDGGTGFVVLDGTTNGDSEDAIQMYFPTAVTGTYFSDGKISTDADTALELKSGSGSGSAQGTVYINGGFRRKAVYKTANYSADHGDYFIGYTTLAAARTVTLPLKSTLGNGHKIVIADVTTGTHAGTNNIIVKEHATDGGTTVATINVDNARVEVEIQNGDWWASPLSAAWARTA